MACKFSGGILVKWKRNKQRKKIENKREINSCAINLYKSDEIEKLQIYYINIIDIHVSEL